MYCRKTATAMMNVTIGKFQSKTCNARISLLFSPKLYKKLAILMKKSQVLQNVGLFCCCCHSINNSMQIVKQRLQKFQICHNKLNVNVYAY